MLSSTQEQDHYTEGTNQVFDFKSNSRRKQPAALSSVRIQLVSILHQTICFYYPSWLGKGADSNPWAPNSAIYKDIECWTICTPFRTQATKGTGNSSETFLEIVGYLYFIQDKRKILLAC